MKPKIRKKPTLEVIWVGNEIEDKNEAGMNPRTGNETETVNENQEWNQYRNESDEWEIKLKIRMKPEWIRELRMKPRP